MNSTYSITQAQSQLPRLVKKTQHANPIAITRHDETVAYLISKEKFQAIIETLEILANADAMQAIRNYEKGKLKFFPMASLHED